MFPIRSLTAGLRSLFRRDQVSREIDEELRHYVEQAALEHVRAGIAPAEAERLARQDVGGVLATRERVMAGGWEAAIDMLARDLRHGARALRRSPGFAAVAILTIALGVGANTAMFSVFNTVMLRPLPWRDASRLALIWTDDPRRGLHREQTAWSTVADWRAASTRFADVASYSTQRIALAPADPGAARGRSRLAYASANLFGVLGVAPVMGRVVSADDERDRSPVAVISHALWQRWFRGDSAILGRTVAIDDITKTGPGTLTIIGVMPEGFWFPDQQTDLWVPATRYWRFDREIAERFPAPMRHWVAVGRLASGASIDDARVDLARLGRRLAAVHATTDPDFPGFGTTVLPILDSIAGRNLQTALWVLLAAVSLVLLVACVNVATLLLARGAARQQEFAVRRALGAGRARVASQLIAECLVLAAAGGVAGTLVAAWGAKALGRAAADFVPRIDGIATDWRVLTFALVASILAGLAFGVAPALRLSAAEAAEALREGGHGTGRVALRRSRDVLVVAECALAIVVLTGAGLMLRSLERLQAVGPGFDPANVLAVRIEFPSALTPGTASQQARVGAHEAMANDLLERLQALPGVATAGFIDDLFLTGPGNESITIPGQPADQMGAGELAEGAVTPGFFPALRVPLRRGRYLSREDAAKKIRAQWSVLAANLTLAEKERVSTPEPVVVNEAFVRRFFPNQDPIGRKFCIDPENKTYFYEIVGVVGDMRRQGLERRAIPQYFGPYIPTANGRADLLVRTDGDPLALAPAIRSLVANAVPGVTIVSVSTADAQLGGFSALRRLQTWLLTTFALLALALAAIGIFGMVHFAVAERTREIGVRVALGAGPARVMAMVLSQGMRTALSGVLVGIGGAAALTRIMSSLLFEVGAMDPVTFAAAGLLLTLVAATACTVAGRRALCVDPVQALRQG